MYILNFSYFSILPLLFVGILFYLLNKKKNQQKNAKGKRNKDDLWHIVKEYLKSNKKHGYNIQDLTLYPRPTKKELNSYIYTAQCRMQEDQALLDKTKYVKPKRQKKYDIESYFENLENTTKRDVNVFNVENKNAEKNRKRYVICFRTALQTQDTPSEWEAIELELFKNYDAQNNPLYEVCFNQELNYAKELNWIYPMQIDYLEKNKKDLERRERESRKQRASDNKNSFKESINQWLIKVKILRKR